jgi:regulator of sigma E protease
MDLIVNFLPYVGYIMLAITILVFVHEMGHFLTAKFFGMRVERFSVGFPPKLVSKQIGETEYVLGATPLGGYVKILGMVDESMDTGGLSAPAEPWEFRAKPVWQRIVVITAGVIFNMILAWIIFAALKGTYGEEYIPAANIPGIYVYEESLAAELGLQTGDRIVAVGGEPLERFVDLNERMVTVDPLTITVERDGREVVLEGPRDIMTRMSRTQGALGINIIPPLVGGVAQDSPADSAGLRPGDRIVRVGERDVAFWSELSEAVQASAGAPLAVEFVRPDSLADLVPSDAPIRAVSQAPGETRYAATLRPMRSDSLWVLGVAASDEASVRSFYGQRAQRYGPIEAVGAGWNETMQQTGNIVGNLGRIFSGRDDLRENLGGPVMVAKVARDAARAGWRYFWQIVGLLSITLAVLNILPIPALDGGHLVFLIYEAITRREPSLKVRMVLQQIGMVVLLLFMVFLFANDFIRLLTS